MTRDHLIGRWRCVRTGTLYDLATDGTCETRTPRRDGTEAVERAEWKFVDATHFTLRLTIPPDPDAPGLEDGAVELTEYEIRAETTGEMHLAEFDVEFLWEWRKES